MDKLLSKFLLILSILFLSTNLESKLNGSGATFPANLYFKWSSDYTKATSTRVNYQSVGSGTGVRQIESKIVDFGATDVALSIKDLNKKGLIQFPTVVGAITVVVNISGVKDYNLRLSNNILADIFLGKIKKWNDPKIIKLNKNIKLPDDKITVIYRSDGSGTTENFTKYLSKISKKWRKNIGHGKSVRWKTGLSGKGNAGVSSMVGMVKNSIGYVEQNFKILNNLTAVKLMSSNKNYVTAENRYINNAIKSVKLKVSNGFNMNLLYSRGNSYPILTATYIILRKNNRKKNQEFLNFLNYAYSKQGDRSAYMLTFKPMSSKNKKIIVKYIKENAI